MKKTKIVATISDKTCTPEFLQKLYDNGMNVIRLNTAHQEPEEALKVIKMAREVSEDIAILIDTKGPEIRTCKVEHDFSFKKDDEVIIRSADKVAHDNVFYVNCDTFIEKVDAGHQVLIDDGYVQLEVIKKEDGALFCKASNDGEIKSRKSVNVPNVYFNLPSLNEKDKRFIKFAAENDVDFIAHSFVRYKEDAQAVQELLDKYNSKIKIIAKIENQQGVDNLEEILDNVYGVMVARGDLAVEIPFEKIPGVQRMIIQRCNQRKKPVIVATQMLHSMIHEPRPTRAEVNDVASAIYRRADAIMLSGETAYGIYPVESVAAMKRIAIEVEQTKDDNLDFPVKEMHSKVSAHLAKYAVEAGMSLNAKAIVSDTNTGRTPRSLSSYHGRIPIISICYQKRTMRELSLSYGVYPIYMEPKSTSHEFTKEALLKLQEAFNLSDDDLLVIIAGNFGPYEGASYIEIGTTSQLKALDNQG